MCMISVSGLCLCLRDTVLRFNYVNCIDLTMFDQQSFTEAVGITAVAIAQAGIAGRQEDPSNLQRFRAHYPPTFTGGGDPMVADHWFMQIEKVLEAMEITSDATRIKLAAFQLKGEALGMVEMGKDL